MRHLNESLSRRAALGRMGGFMLLALLPPNGRGGRSGPRSRDGFPHPDPRPGITAANVLPDDNLPNKKRVRAAYDVAREHPEIFDGVYCICDCSEEHRSLLSCFESKQPTGCWGCQEQAELIGRLAKNGKNLAEIRSAIDKKWGESSHDRH